LSFSIRNSKLAALLLCAAILCVLPGSAVAGTTARKTARKASTHVSAKKTSRKARVKRASKRSWRSRGQHHIAADRAREIQEALIRANYLDGKADGVWGPTSEAAMARYQADNGWQSKVVPDSRALIKLGLGPDRSSVINPESLQSSLQPQSVRGGQD
jgi:peptidoglycan hydrolase-like protein with peptidoglycan-binding domain